MPVRPLPLGKHLWCFRISQVYSYNESKVNLAATKKPLQPHMSSDAYSQGTAVSRGDQARLAQEVPQTPRGRSSLAGRCGGGSRAAAALLLPHSRSCRRSTGSSSARSPRHPAGLPRLPQAEEQELFPTRQPFSLQHTSPQGNTVSGSLWSHFSRSFLSKSYCHYHCFWWCRL